MDSPEVVEQRRRAADDLRQLLIEFRQQDAASEDALDEDAALRIAAEELAAFRRGRL